MNLRCHAIKRRGGRCTSRASGFVKGHPVCARTAHSSGFFRPVTPQSVRPNDYTTVRVLIDFMGGASREAIAAAYGLTVAEVERKIREAMR